MKHSSQPGPCRVQLRRTKGWRMPENTVNVARPGKWGNHFVVWRDDGGQWYCTRDWREHYDVADKAEGLRMAVERHAAEFRTSLRGYGGRSELIELRGKNLACWCPLDQPCHADVLLELANEPINGQ